jgi:hypothetical protein
VGLTTGELASLSAVAASGIAGVAGEQVSSVIETVACPEAPLCDAAALQQRLSSLPA